MRFQQLFGDTDVFALRIGLRGDPAPPVGASKALCASWGDVEVWVKGMCLTQHAYEGVTGNGVTWYLLPLLSWLSENALELLNREPFPYPLSRTTGTAVDWLDRASEGRPARASSWNDDDWFDERYAFWGTHTLRAGMPGAAVPNIVFHRVGDDIEVSWDNDIAPPSRRGLQYTHSRGAHLVSGAFFEATLRQAVRAASHKLREDGAEFAPRGLLDDISTDASEGWRLLLPRKTADLVSGHASLKAEILDGLRPEGAFIPHSLLTSVLRAVEVDSIPALDAVVRSVRRRVTKRLVDQVVELRAPSTAPRSKAWRSGYACAGTIRQRLGWGQDALPAHELRGRLESLGFDISDEDLPHRTECAALAFGGDRGRVLLSKSLGMSPVMKLATALGHFLLDLPRERDYGAVSSPWMDAPSVARAKAFGAMLLMPEERCFALAEDHEDPDALVRAVMVAFATPRQATAWHLYHLRLLDQDELSVALQGAVPD